MTDPDPRIIAALDPEPTDEDRALANSMLNESDRGCVIAVTDLLDERLERLFRTFCRRGSGDAKRFVDPLFQVYGPLATFSAKIRLAYAMQLIPSATREQLDLTRKLRNDFAHHWGAVSLNDRERSALLAVLASKVPRTDSELQDMSESEGAPPRMKFVCCAASIGADLMVIEEMIKLGVDVRALFEKHTSMHNALAEVSTSLRS